MTERAPFALLVGTVLDPDHLPGAVGVITGGTRIDRVLFRDDVIPEGVTVIDLGAEATLLPGFIDVHTHGGWGLRYVDGPDAARAILKRRAESGCTGLLMTVGNYGHVANPTDGPKAWADAMAAWLPGVATAVDVPTGGARAIGLHIEGPWLNWDAWVAWGAREASGRSAILPEWDDFARLQDAAAGAIRLVSAAPEFPGALDFIGRLANAGVVVSIGHTTAPPELVREAVDAGARHATHTFNGMQPLHHRNPGAAGAVMTDDRVVCELIADGAHVHPIMQQVLWRAKGARGVALVTDATAWAGLPPGSHSDPNTGRTFEVRDDLGCWSATGNLAGSGSPADRNFALLTTIGGVPLPDAARMGSTVPAAQLGLSDRKGRIAPGFDADLCVLAPVPGARLGGDLPDPDRAPGSDRRCVLTVVAGEIVYRSPLVTAGTHDPAIDPHAPPGQSPNVTTHAPWGLILNAGR
jgi:N-acetylglucosamine-6-phosphate deacetylase